jgi:DHA2 family multidrug resistance protein
LSSANKRPISVYTPAYQQALAQVHAFGLSDQSTAGLMTQGLISQSYLLSSLDLFYLSGWRPCSETR